MENKVVRNVVNDDGFVHISAQQAEIFYQEWAILRSVLAVKSVLDVLSDINLVNDLVCILLESCCEDDDFVVFRHCLNECDATWPHKEETIVLVFNIVDQSLI